MGKMIQKTFCRKILWLVVATFLCIPANAATYTANELDTLVSTIALYPDPLLAHVLTASTHQDEIPSASLWASSHKNMKGETLTAEMESAELDYDASILALIPFPTVLATMAKYSTWTSQLGEAVTNQNGEVMNAVQRMRKTAQAHGNLKSDQQNTVEQKIIENKTIISIEPVRTEYIYVPLYNPSVVYYVYSDSYTPMRYSYGVWIGHWYSDWAWNDCWFEWHSHVIRHHPRPPRHYNHPHKSAPSYGPGHTRPGNVHKLPSSAQAPKPATSSKAQPPVKQAPQQEPKRFEQPQPFLKDHSSNKFEFRNTSKQGSQGGYGNVTTTSSKGSSNNYDERDDRSNRNNNSRNESSGGFRKTMRR